MDHLARIAYINSQVVCAQAEIAGMVAENMQRAACGHSMAFTEEHFEPIPEKYGITHNRVIAYLTD